MHDLQEYVWYEVPAQKVYAGRIKYMPYYRSWWQPSETIDRDMMNGYNMKKKRLILELMNISHDGMTYFQPKCYNMDDMIQVKMICGGWEIYGMAIGLE
jgi:hypothetical protein